MQIFHVYIVLSAELRKTETISLISQELKPLLQTLCFRDRPFRSNMAEKKLGFFESFMLSGAAAGVSKTAAAPIERVKLLVQNQDEMIKQVEKYFSRL